MNVRIISTAAVTAAMLLGMAAAAAADETATAGASGASATTGTASSAPAPAPATAPTTAPAMAPAPAAAATDAAFDFFLQEAQVVTASRRAQAKSESPVAIDVITREEIQASGAKSIWDLLRFKVGMDVTQASSIDGNPAEVNVRGLPGEFSQSLQVLIDGRSVVQSTNSGVYWQDLPVSLDDIERIEIVRGPNSPLFGANAGQGVINIITIKPGDTNGAEFRGEVGQYGWHRGQVGMNESIGDLRLRVSLQDSEMSSDPNAKGDTSLDLNGVPLDRRFNLRGDWDAWAGGEIEIFGGGMDTQYGIPSGALSLGSGSYNERYGMLQLHQKLGDQALDLTVHGRQDHNDYSTADNAENDYFADLMLRLNYWDNRSTTNLGVSLGDEHVASNFLFDGFNAPMVTDEENHQRRAYIQESLAAVDWVTLSLAASFEDSDLGGEWPAYQGALIFKPIENNTLRVSAGRSPTMPSMQNRLMAVVFSEGSVTEPIGFIPPSTVVYGTIPVYVNATGGNVAPTQISDYEATWTGSWFDRHFTSEITGYQMEVNGQVEIDGTGQPGTETLPAGSVFPSFMGSAIVQNVPYENALFVRMRGLETVLTLKPWAGTSLELNHTYEDVYTSGANNEPGTSNYEATAYTTPWNKVNLIARTELFFGFNASAEIGFVGSHYNYLASRSADVWINDQAVVDLRIGYRPTKDLELYVTGQNLGQEIRTEGADGVGIPQVYGGGLTLAFGN